MLKQIVHCFGTICSEMVDKYNWVYQTEAEMWLPRLDLNQ